MSLLPLESTDLGAERLAVLGGRLLLEVLALKQQVIAGEPVLLQLLLERGQLLVDLLDLGAGAIRLEVDLRQFVGQFTDLFGRLAERSVERVRLLVTRIEGGTRLLLLASRLFVVLLHLHQRIARLCQCRLVLLLRAPGFL